MVAALIVIHESTLGKINWLAESEHEQLHTAGIMLPDNSKKAVTMDSGLHAWQNRELLTLRKCDNAFLPNPLLDEDIFFNLD